MPCEARRLRFDPDVVGGEKRCDENKDSGQENRHRTRFQKQPPAANRAREIDDPDRAMMRRSEPR